MGLAVAEARRGLGLTAPNPAVGAVVVRDGVVIGRGFHAKAGEAHAEPQALAAAGAEARGAELYVTLEPCCTQGRTPPCTEAIVRAGIRRVYVGCTDPNPAHAGRGFGVLRAAGVEVVEGVLEAECQRLIRGFSQVQREGRAFVSLKMATSLDGRIADGAGVSQWITGEESRARVQGFRREADAVLVGTETLRADDPSLQPRPAEGRRPWRIVPDRRGTLPLSLRVFSDEDRERTLCVLGGGAAAGRREALEERGVAWMESAEDGEGLVWGEVLTRLAAERGVMQVLCEGGGRLAGALLKAGLVGELLWFQAPVVLGAAGRPAVEGAYALAAAPRFRRVELEVLGADVFARYEPVI